MRLTPGVSALGRKASQPFGSLGCAGGSATALVTPFRHEQVDAAALAALCERQVRAGTSALVVCGSTGEAPALSAAEQARVVAAAVEAAAGRVPVDCGVRRPGDGGGDPAGGQRGAERRRRAAVRRAALCPADAGGHCGARPGGGACRRPAGGSLPLFGESNPIPVKAALWAAGLCNGDQRLPLIRARSETLGVLNRLLPDLLQAEGGAAVLPRLALVT